MNTAGSSSGQESCKDVYSVKIGLWGLRLGAVLGRLTYFAM